MISSRAVSAASDEIQAGQLGALQMARESGRLGLLQGTGATNTSRARERILREPAPRPALTREGEPGVRPPARQRTRTNRVCPLLTYT